MQKMNKNKEVLKYIAFFVLLLAVYLYAGKFGLSLAYFNKSASPIWPPAGIALVAVVIFGYRFLPAILIGAFLVNYTTTPSLAVSSLIAIGNTFETFIGAFLINRFANGKDVFLSVKTTRNFFLIISLSSLVSAVIGIYSLSLGGLLLNSGLIQTAFTWWIGNFVGTLIIFPLVLTLYHKAPINIQKKDYVGIAIAYTVLIFISLIIFLGWPVQINKSFGFVFVCFPLLVWIAFISCLRFTAIAVFITSIIAMLGTINRLSIFNINAINEALILLQIFISIITMTSMLISVDIIKYKNKIRAYKRSQS